MKPLSSASLSGVERTFEPEEIIVSKTDLRGRITYANAVFQRVAEMTEAELLGQPHSIIRHPDMPRCVFRLLWDTLQDGREIFAYVVNRSKSGGHYWVFAHVTPTFDERGRIVGYHSNRRVPDREAVEQAEKVYAMLRQEESRHGHPREAADAGVRLLNKILKDAGVTYEQWVFSLAPVEVG
jgi:PAS domain S-box-containing protein